MGCLIALLIFLVFLANPFIGIVLLIIALIVGSSNKG